MKKIQPRPSTAGLHNSGSKGAASELSQSMKDLSVHKTETNHVPVPRFKASVSAFVFLTVYEWKSFFLIGVTEG